MTDDRASRRYISVAAALRWSVAAVLLVQFPVGYIFHGMDYGATRDAWFVWHKTLGVAILLLLLVLIAWRVRHPGPAVLTDRAPCVRALTRWSEPALLVLLVGLSLTGLLSVSAWPDEGAATDLAGGMQLPLIPGIPPAIGDSAEQFHKLLVSLTLWLILLNAAAAVWHWLMRRGDDGSAG